MGLVTGMGALDGVGEKGEGGKAAEKARGEDKGLVGPLDATVAFLESERGVRQALEMAGEEMRTITEEGWGEEVWGAAAATAGFLDQVTAVTTRVDGDVARDGDGGTVTVGEQTKRTRPPKLLFYFAKTDHWVADHTRDELLRLRGRTDGKGEEWKPEMVVDEEDGLVHGWCIRQSELVAGKVGGWIAEMLREGGEGEQGRTR